MAAGEGHANIVRLLLDHANDYNWPLLTAAWGGHENTVS